MSRSLIISIAVLVLSAASVAAVFLWLSGRPACPEPFVFALPIELDLATSVLYPGQVRGGDFKPHGGFRFDNSAPDEIEVRAPYSGRVTEVGRYKIDNNEIQYTFEFEHPCGIRWRFGHLRLLAPKFQEIADAFPIRVGDSQTYSVEPPVEVAAGELVATAVGMFEYQGRENTFLDWGVYDWRRKNEASQDPEWAAAYPNDTEQYGVCWFDWISAEDRERVLALPSSDSRSGTSSDYCD